MRFLGDFDNFPQNFFSSSSREALVLVQVYKKSSASKHLTNCGIPARGRAVAHAVGWSVYQDNFGGIVSGTSSGYLSG